MVPSFSSSYTDAPDNHLEYLKIYTVVSIVSEAVWGMGNGNGDVLGCLRESLGVSGWYFGMSKLLWESLGVT